MTNDALAHPHPLPAPSWSRRDGRTETAGDGPTAVGLTGHLDETDRAGLTHLLRAERTALAGSGLKLDPAESETVLDHLAEIAVRARCWQDHPALTAAEKDTLALERILPVARRIACTRLGRQHHRPTTRARTDADEATLAASAAMADRGLLTKARGRTVLAWTRVMAQETTTHPYRATGPDGSRPGGAGTLFDPGTRDMLGDIKQMAVDFNALADDIADEVHDRELLAAMAAIPGTGGRIRRTADAGLAAAARRLPKGWRPYYDTMAHIWESLVQQLLELSGERAFRRHEAQLCRDYRAIVGCLSDNLELNADPARIPPAAEHTRLMLEGHNMNFLAFETMDRMVADSRCDTLPAPDSDTYRAFRRLCLLLQGNGQCANALATWRAELEEGCLANEVVLTALGHDTGSGPSDPSDLSGSFDPSGIGLAADLRRLCAARAAHPTTPGRDRVPGRDREHIARLTADIIHRVEASGAERRCHQRWTKRRAAALDLVRAHPAIDTFVDTERLIAGHDTLLAMYLVYEGRI
ncbi:hypothetical protein CRV15_31320 (plasmid) [Streptomyces clavuligerus]|uniref:Uncharacterized protein n=2 Tax=Streptomyces clavuligerus TaxID=1901 RepID=B5H2T1_STRCL|nr:hypothetical protein [Streptomyces clavuligerus]EDY52877.1 hypothetical protein SSCG_05860 [Streptomyces clavuligerus]EFG04152.1 Hypothetical protein SCLAV_p0665 [Streptomyces clavuligerus]MBY6307366.1 hypothetical protein [Streptomyces clavuligerus]QCS10070.1 hypothetical protein CRV15_31320 [Streptomyces clavuligerus]QPJ97885.1 hypothetical protein GE265_33130 [Streptomyces clavuligerus]